MEFNEIDSAAIERKLGKKMLAERNKRARTETSADPDGAGAGADTAAADAAAEAAIARIAEGINAAPVMGSEAAATSTTGADDGLEAPAGAAASSSSAVAGNGGASSSLTAAAAASDNKKKGLLFPPFLIVHTPRAGDVRLNANKSNSEVRHSRFHTPSTVAPEVSRAHDRAGAPVLLRALRGV